MRKLISLFLVLVFWLGISFVASAHDEQDHGRRVHGMFGRRVHGRFGRFRHDEREFDNRQGRHIRNVRIERHVRIVTTPHSRIRIRKRVRIEDTNVPVRLRRHVRVEHRHEFNHRY